MVPARQHRQRGDITDSAGNIIDTIQYNTFGVASDPHPLLSDRYLYTSREYDKELDLQYNRARYYDANTGRWISQDPLGFDAGDSNLYRYVKMGRRVRRTQVVLSLGFMRLGLRLGFL